MTRIHPSRILEEVDYETGDQFCIACEVCECHSPETLKKECEYA